MSMEDTTTEYGPDYEKYAKLLISNLAEDGYDAAGEPELVDERAEEMAKTLILDAERLKEVAHEQAPEGTLIGNIHEGGHK